MKVSYNLKLFGIVFLGLIFGINNLSGQTISTKKERNLITSGNKLYNEGKYKDALEKYRSALQNNPSSAVALYNMAMSQVMIGSNPADTTEGARKIKSEGISNLNKVAAMSAVKPSLASKADYNLGNIAFQQEDYSNALNYYKQALRLNPDDDNARRNLRITQLKIQNQDNNQDNQDNNDEKDQQQDNKENEEQQDKPEDQNNQDRNQDSQDQNQPQEQQRPDISDQTVEQILNAMENKENQTRTRVANEQGEKSYGTNRSRYNW